MTGELSHEQVEPQAHRGAVPDLKANTVIVGTGQITQTMMDTLLRIAHDSRRNSPIEPYAVVKRDVRHEPITLRYGNGVMTTMSAVTCCVHPTAPKSSAALKTTQSVKTSTTSKA